MGLECAADVGGGAGDDLDGVPGDAFDFFDKEEVRRLTDSDSEHTSDKKEREYAVVGEEIWWEDIGDAWVGDTGA